MKKSVYIRSNHIIVIIFTALIFAVSPLIYSQEQEHDALEYEVSVKALQVPFVAVDAQGKPVYDLKSDELELIVNKKKVDI